MGKASDAARLLRERKAKKQEERSEIVEPLRRKLGWWFRIDGNWIGPYDKKAEAVDDLRGLKRFFKITEGRKRGSKKTAS